MKAGTAGRIAVAIALLAGATAGCTRQVSGPELVLRLASPDLPDDPTGPAIQHFANEVAARSRGAIRIDPVWDVTTDLARSWDQTVARGVAGGTWDMGLVPGRAWDEVGVDSLRALNTPFLVTSEAALEAVLESDVRDDLLAGLPAAGVVGLDLFPDGLRHPFGFDEPLLGAEDYSAETIRTPRSDTVTRLFAAFGATTTDARADSSNQRGVESDFAGARAQVATGNVTFFPKTNVLALDADVRPRLRDDQWRLLQDAASATRTWLYDEQPSEQESAAAYCAQGGSIVAASPAQLDGLEQAAEPATAWLRRDPGTRRLVTEIHAVVDGVDGEPPVATCPQDAVEPPGDPEAASINGIYVSRVTRHQLIAAGETNPTQLTENTGTFTWVLEDGRWSYRQVSHHFVSTPTRASGRYTYIAGLFTLHWTEGPEEYSSAQLAIDADGSIHFTGVHDGHPENQALAEGVFQVWTRTGDLPS
jgi:TRAP-type C4-dicarboxylate transport system substrate-binding protein